MIIVGPVAIAKNNIIGGNNDLPWYLPEDLKHFKEITMGKTVIMGRKTYDSIIARLGKPLPGRINVVITRNPDFNTLPEVLVFHSLEDAFAALKNEDVYVIGGAQIFAAALPFAEKMYITHVYQEYPGDVYFPNVDWDQWEKIEDEPHGQFSFAVYKKASPASWKSRSQTRPIKDSCRRDESVGPRAACLRIWPLLRSRQRYSIGGKCTVR